MVTRHPPLQTTQKEHITMRPNSTCIFRITYDKYIRIVSLSVWRITHRRHSNEEHPSLIVGLLILSLKIIRHPPYLIYKVIVKN